MTNPMNRRTFTARLTTVLAAPLALLGWRKGEAKPCEHPLIMDFLNDNNHDAIPVAARITRFFELIDTRTDKPLVNPDGGFGVYFADEATGVCRAYKKPVSQYGYRTPYTVIVGTDRRPTKEERLSSIDPKTGCQMNPPLEIAWQEFVAPIRFVPRKGKEKEAAELRRWYAERERACGSRPAIPVVRKANRFPYRNWDDERNKSVESNIA